MSAIDDANKIGAQIEALETLTANLAKRTDEINLPLVAAADLDPGREDMQHVANALHSAAENLTRAREALDVFVAFQARQELARGRTR